MSQALLNLGKRGLKATMSVTAVAAAIGANDVMGTAKTLTFTYDDGTTFEGGELMITSSSLEVDHTAVVAGETTYTLHLYNVTPPSAHADNDLWDLPSGDRASYLGFLALGTPVDLGSTLYVETNNLGKQITVTSTGLVFAELVTVGGFTPTAAVRKVVLHARAVT